MEQESVMGLEPTWAVIELFGHSQIAGRLSTVTLGGSVLLRVEVPETVRESIEHGYFEGSRIYGAKEKVETRTPAYSRLFGVGAIYAINPCTESVARAMARRIPDSEVARTSAVESRTALPPPAPIEVDFKSLGDGTAEAADSKPPGEELCICGHMRQYHDETYGCQVEVDGDGNDQQEEQEGNQCICEVFELAELPQATNSATEDF